MRVHVVKQFDVSPRGYDLVTVREGAQDLDGYVLEVALRNGWAEPAADGAAETDPGPTPPRSGRGGRRPGGER